MSEELTPEKAKEVASIEKILERNYRKQHPLIGELEAERDRWYGAAQERRIALNKADAELARLRAEVERLRDTNERFIADFALIAGKLGEFEEQNALRAAKEKAAAALCRAREAIRSKVIDALNRHQAPMEACQDVVDSIEAALSSSSLCPHEAVAKNVRHCERCGGSYYDDGLVNLRCPCENPHEARVKELEAELAWYKEAVKWAIENGDEINTIDNPSTWKAELRRRGGVK